MKDLSSLEKYYKVLSSRKRLHILLVLKNEKGATVSDIAESIHLSKFGTSQHLRVLRNLDIVVTRKRGKFMTYRLALKHPPIINNALKLL